MTTRICSKCKRAYLRYNFESSETINDVVNISGDEYYYGDGDGQDLCPQCHNNKPLRLEDLEEGMWVWDNASKMYCQVISTTHYYDGYIKLFYGGQMVTTKYEDGIYFRKEVK